MLVLVCCYHCMQILFISLIPPHKDLLFKTNLTEWTNSGLDGTYGYHTGNGSYNGMIGALQRKDADIGVQVISELFARFVSFRSVCLSQELLNIVVFNF